MSFDVSGFGTPPFISPPAGLFGYGLMTLYALAVLVALWATRRRWGRLSLAQWLSLPALILAGVALAQLVILRVPADILPPPGLPIQPQRPGLPFFALVPAFLAAGWLGGGPAIVVGFFTGLSRAAWETYSALTPFEYALVAAAAAACLRQDYRGWLPALFRHPAVVGVVVGGLLWPSLFFSYFAYTEAAGMAAVDYVASLVFAAVPVFVGQVVLAGVAAQLVKAGLPAWWVRRRGLEPPPYLRSLNRKLLFTLIPLFVFGIAFMFWSDVTVATRVSTGLLVRQMERAAQNAGRDIPFFIQTGQDLLSGIADSRDWFESDPLAQKADLLQGMRALAFFKQLLLFTPDLELSAVAGFRVDQDEQATLDEEQTQFARLALQGLPQNTVQFFADAEGQTTAEVVFMTPVRDPDTRQTTGVLVGRADLASNPLMQSTFSNLTSMAGGVGAGFLVDDRGLIIYHPDPTYLRQPFSVEAAAAPLETALADAEAYQDRAPDGTRRLILYYPVPGHPWSVVIQVPQWLALQLMTEIAAPILIILLVIGLLGLVLVSAIALRVTRPAEALALAAQRISDNQLDQPVEVEGEDEIGRAGQAFERMRQRLRARLSELNLLLKVSQGVSSSLNLDDALPAILQGALTATSAAGVRIALAPPEGAATAAPGAIHVTYADGAAAPAMAALDRGLLELTRSEGRVVIENVARARAVLDVAPVVGKLHALIALPLRQEATFYGVLWLGYDQPHVFGENEVNFLTTLAGQAAVAIANARLFDAAEQGRRRLAAILASTPDAVVVTDRNNRLLLLNPAAEATFELTGKPVTGRLAADVLPDRALARLLAGAGGGATTGEFSSPAGRTLYASVSPIISADGAALGRVCVLRDVTHFKELDLMKSEFVATVSHDLRAPLTFMRGYATMLPMVGALTDKQREFADKIILGIEQMTKLIDDLLDLGRIEAGVGLAKEPCQLDEIVGSVMDTLGPVAANKGLTLQADIPRNLPLLSGDPTLLRQAISNLVDNAIKYTPTGGQVKIVLTADNGAFRVAVSDSGVGIAPADQAHLFEKFFRVKQRGSTQVKGSGLGLAIVKSIVERHGGRVWMESKLGKGSTFYLEVPRDSAAVAAARA